MQFAEMPVLSGARPLVGHLPELRADRIAFVKHVMREVDRVSRFLTPAGNAMIVNHPDTVQEVLVDKARAFDKSDMTRFSLYPIGGEGLFTSRYELWRTQRKIMAPLFHPNRLAGYARDMVQCATRVIDTWRDGSTIELAREATRITMSIAGKTLFDADTLSEADEIGHALTVALEWTSKHAPSLFAIAHIMAARGIGRVAARLPFAFAKDSLEPLAARFTGPVVLAGAEGRELRDAVHVLDSTVARMIEARRKEGLSRDDLLSQLLRARDEDSGARMTDKQVRDEVLTLFVAGHETTATGLAWAVHGLCENPSLYATVEHEARALSADPTVDDTRGLPLASRAFKEALRLYPPVYVFGRQAMVDTSVGGYVTPKNAVALISPYALHRRPEIWPDPERFDLNRFTPEAEAARVKHAYLPFGAGPRICIGNHFALMEGQLVLATMLRRVAFEPAGHEEPDPQATLRPKNGMRMRVQLNPAASPN